MLTIINEIQRLKRLPIDLQSRFIIAFDEAHVLDNEKSNILIGKNTRMSCLSLISKAMSCLTEPNDHITPPLQAIYAVLIYLSTSSQIQALPQPLTSQPLLRAEKGDWIFPKSLYKCIENFDILLDRSDLARPHNMQAMGRND